MDELHLLLALLLAACVAGYTYLTSPPRSIYATTRQQIQNLLDPLGIDEQAKLLARALPNTRLIPAFDIRSTFVSDAPALHHSFLAETRDLLRHWSGDWAAFGDKTATVVAKFLKPIQMGADGSTSISFDSFVQAATLTIVLVTFFETDIDILEFHDVVFVARAINDRWRDSKKCTTMSRDGLDEINAHLRRWVPPAFKNPLELIIPSYETMWRVVAITVAYEHRNSQAHTTCDEFLQYPDYNSYKREAPDSYSIQAMIQESLRLHPPTKHISRATPIHSSILRAVLELFGIRYLSRGVADVETVQRSPAWGPNPDVFDPSRHARKEVQENPDAVMFAFGYGSTRCVASKVAPHAAGILFATIMGAVSPAGGLVVDDDEGSPIGGREGWEKWCIRKSVVRFFLLVVFRGLICYLSAYEDGVMPALVIYAVT